MDKPEDVTGSGANHCSTDGVYRYRWTTRFGRHTVYFDVKDGVIQENIANQVSPIKMFEGKTTKDFDYARLQGDWRFKGDSFHQMTSVDSP
jgi:hypothetical protein